MKVTLIGEPKIIMSNPTSKHNYFAWPTVTRLKDGRLAVVASGYRLRHVCPFGKTVISYSYDEGETYTAPAPVFDTVLDDRDGGILAFGESSVLVTSFTLSVDAVRRHPSCTDAYTNAYLDTITPEEEAKYSGSTCRISHDNGKTFGEIFKTPISSPHGPIELQDGRILYVGTIPENRRATENGIQAYILNMDGTCEKIGEIENTDEFENIGHYETHVVQLDDGKLIAHVRVDGPGVLTIYQSESDDLGKTWTKPVRLLDKMGGSPSHILKLSSGVLVATYSYRLAPFGVKFMVSRDNGKTWETDIWLYENGVCGDLGYPSTVELKDGSLLTVFYAHPAKGEPAVIMQQKWRLED